MQRSSKPNVAILGGGVGGLETAFYLRMKLPFGLEPDKLKMGLRGSWLVLEKG